MAKEAKKHPVADRKLQGAMLGVVEAPGVLLSLQKASANLGEELVAVGEEGVHSVRAGTAGRVW